MLVPGGSEGSVGSIVVGGCDGSITAVMTGSDEDMVLLLLLLLDSRAGAEGGLAVVAAIELEESCGIEDGSDFDRASGHSLVSTSSGWD